MIELTIPGRGVLTLEHLVMDVEGALALDGRMPDELAPLLNELRDRLTLHLLAIDLYRQQDWLDRRLGLQSARFPLGLAEDAPLAGPQKLALVEQLGAARVVAIGHGADDAPMLAAAALGICVFSPEGTAQEAMQAADLVVTSMQAALELLTHPLRIVASLRR